MAVFTRTNGSAKTVVSVGNVALSAETTGVPISTGIGKPIRCIGFTANNSVAAQMGTGEVVEAVLAYVGLTNTVLAYQVDTTRISVVMEDSSESFTTANANAIIDGRRITGFGINAVTDLGLKLAAS